LSSALKDGAIQAGRGSLAEVLPPSLLDTFVAGSGDASVNWVASAGGVHRFHVVSGAQKTAVHTQPTRGTSLRPSDETDFERVDDPAASRQSVGAVIGSLDAVSPLTEDGGSSDLLVGLSVHRLLQRFGIAAPPDDGILLAAISDLLRKEERIETYGRPELLQDILARFAALRQHPRLRGHYETGHVFHEVPFSFREEGRIIRGTIDCLIRQADGTLRILEFKTGRQRDEHARQAEIYRRAVAAAFPDTPVAVDVVYAIGHPES
jgi:ATP-dependent exoDNAse (exonuclease V) beta subunit